MRKFTLIELLVVTSIIGTLSSLILPALAQGRSKVKQAVCINNIRQVGLACLSYTNENNSYGPRDDTLVEKKKWFKRIMPDYLPKGQTKGAHEVNKCPAGLTAKHKKHTNIGINVRISGKNESDRFVRQRSTQSASPETVFLMDSFNRARFTSPWVVTNRKLIESGPQKRIARHPKNTANIFFIDGSTSSRTYQFLITKSTYGEVFWNPEK